MNDNSKKQWSSIYNAAQQWAHKIVIHKTEKSAIQPDKISGSSTYWKTARNEANNHLSVFLAVNQSLNGSADD